MSRLKNLLAATDLSGPARHAAARAARLTAESGACLSLVHVINKGALQALRHLLQQTSSALETELLDDARESCHQLAADIAQPHQISADIRLRVGNAIDEIASEADALDASLLVMGNRGAGFLSEIPIGSTTERLLHRLRRPLLVVKQTPHETYRRVLIPVDFSPSSLHALQLAHTVAPTADLILCHAFEVPFEHQLRRADLNEETILSYRNTVRREAMQQMEKLAAASNIPPSRIRRLVLHGNTIAHILTQEQELDCDLIVMGKHGHNMLNEWLLGSVSKHVLAQSCCDVLVTSQGQQPT